MLVQDSITGPDLKNFTASVQRSTTTNTSEYLYDLKPGNISFSRLTAYSLPLSVVASSDGWPNRFFLLFAIMEVRVAALYQGQKQV